GIYFASDEKRRHRRYRYKFRRIKNSKIQPNISEGGEKTKRKLFKLIPNSFLLSFWRKLKNDFQLFRSHIHVDNHPILINQIIFKTFVQAKFFIYLGTR